jgi:hypothetical protein
LLSPSPSLALASRPIDRIISSCIANCSARPFFSESHIGSQSFHPPVPYASASSRVVAAVASIVAVIITIARRVDRSSRASSSSRATARVVVVVVARRAFARVARRALARVVVGRVVVVGHVIIGIVAMCRATIRFARARPRRHRDFYAARDRSRSRRRASARATRRRRSSRRRRRRRARKKNIDGAGVKARCGGSRDAGARDASNPRARFFATGADGWMDGWMPGRPGRQVAARRDVAVRGVPGDVRGEVCGACARDEPNDATRRDERRR